ncbi:LysR family transcriptional regulator [Pseudooceanicola nanhaiensis]|jgi:DNA-binding transcriptional LysR family regulator|uniref:LysR family transcriptional regulator n=1 Tax=Pseudooceanicola nanhaiensis TaxID=375761 RepID=A0A917SWB6_9RHOB|nr:LysR family transcriptional regulator [Pseudooceanicola nanhaiensis]GGM01923.1 LysR family transcriptional regulator [Pseudooceanicola nanhaiensis]
MNSPAAAFDWNQARAFLATAETGSLSAAARQLGQTQPTLGRQIAALEDRLGVQLFDRVGRGLVLTQAGRELMVHVRTMEEAATRFSLAATGRSEEIAGEVSVTASDMMATYTLPPILAALARTAPEIRIRLIASNDLQDLTRREADIALRHVRPTQGDLTARLVAEGTARMYATPGYLDRIGRPASLADLARASFIAMGPAEDYARQLGLRGIPVAPAQITHSTDSGLAYWALVREGLGIGIMADDIAARTPGIEAILPDLAVVQVPVWLVTHRELHSSRRIRLVYDTLAAALSGR